VAKSRRQMAALAEDGNDKVGRSQLGFPRSRESRCGRGDQIDQNRGIYPIGAKQNLGWQGSCQRLEATRGRSGACGCEEKGREGERVRRVGSGQGLDPSQPRPTRSVGPSPAGPVGFGPTSPFGLVLFSKNH
jgi:hypothetical protein